MMKRTPRDLADRMARRGRSDSLDGYVRESYERLPRDEAREAAEAFFRRWPKAAYDSEVESWSAEPGDLITFTMRRLRSAD